MRSLLRAIGIKLIGREFRTLEQAGRALCGMRPGALRAEANGVERGMQEGHGKAHLASYLRRLADMREDLDRDTQVRSLPLPDGSRET